ncbi:hypothetical protein AB4Z42_14645 [Mycobacterium sp. 2YAF39]|uniref:hypothetical protein n=1 Tax=Mycobacterium sp. 2YAF39 TaxID=3233033 RepID=UPI003F9EA397
MSNTDAAPAEVACAPWSSPAVCISRDTAGRTRGLEPNAFTRLLVAKSRPKDAVSS